MSGPLILSAMPYFKLFARIQILIREDLILLAGSASEFNIIIPDPMHSIEFFIYIFGIRYAAHFYTYCTVQEESHSSSGQGKEKEGKIRMPVPDIPQVSQV